MVYDLELVIGSVAGVGTVVPAGQRRASWRGDAFDALGSIAESKCQDVACVRKKEESDVNGSAQTLF